MNQTLPQLPTRWNRLAWGVMMTLVVVTSMGASCTPRAGLPFGPTGPSAPTVLSATPTAAELVAAVNQNSSRVTTYQAPRATVAMPQVAGLPLIKASIAAERPSYPTQPWRLRLRAVTALTGPEIDLGSNDERFWLWARRNEPPAVYTARHDQWASSPVRGQLPIQPAWVVEALGLSTLDPGASYQGPFPRGDGAWELRTQVASAEGVQQRVLVIDSQTAQVREQHLYDVSGELVASVTADRFRYDPVSGASLPERVALNVPAAQMALTINTGTALINAPLADNNALWNPPQLGDYPTVDLTSGGMAQSAQAWDLAGTSATYRPSDSIAKSFGTPAPLASASTDGLSQPYSASSELAQPSFARSAPTTAATTTPTPVVAAQPVPSFAPTSMPQPNRQGFVGLPTG